MAIFNSYFDITRGYTQRAEARLYWQRIFRIFRGQTSIQASLIGEGQDATEPLHARIFKKHSQDGDVLNQTQMMFILTCHDIPCWLHVHVLGR